MIWNFYTWSRLVILPKFVHGSRFQTFVCHNAAILYSPIYSTFTYCILYIYHTCVTSLLFHIERPRTTANNRVRKPPGSFCFCPNPDVLFAKYTGLLTEELYWNSRCKDYWNFHGILDSYVLVMINHLKLISWANWNQLPMCRYCRTYIIHRVMQVSAKEP